MNPHSGFGRKRYFWRKKHRDHFFSKNRELFSFPGSGRLLSARTPFSLSLLRREHCGWGTVSLNSLGGHSASVTCSLFGSCRRPRD